MSQNNNIEEQQNNNLECTKLVETLYEKQETENVSRVDCFTSQQSLTEKFEQHDSIILQHKFMENSSHIINGPLCQPQSQHASSGTLLVSKQEYISTSQILNGLPQQINLHQQTHFVSGSVATPSDINSIKNTMMAESQANFQTQNMGNDIPKESNGSTSNSSYPQVTTAAESKISSPQIQTKFCLTDTTNTPKSNVTAFVENSELPKNTSSGFRVAEFVLKHLDSVPGEEKFYNWSNKTKDFASNNLSKETQEKFYSSVTDSSKSYLDQSVTIDNEQQIKSHNRTSKRKVIESPEKSQHSGNETSPKNKKRNKEKHEKWIAERDHILKKYSHKLMRRKPRSWLPQESSD